MSAFFWEYNGLTMDASQAIPSGQDPIKKKSVWRLIVEWVQVIIVALIISLPIRFFVAEPFIVEGASMDPTFATGQFLIVDRLTYRFHEPQRGDVIVFQYPDDPSKDFIKRVIGLPGETVSIKDGVVTIMTASTSESSAVTKILNEPYVKSIHASHDTLTSQRLGSTEYFVMGDNRAQSSDSRLWGSLDAHFIIGRPIMRLLPITTLSILPGEYKQ